MRIYLKSIIYITLSKQTNKVHCNKNIIKIGLVGSKLPILNIKLVYGLKTLYINRVLNHFCKPLL